MYLGRVKVIAFASFQNTIVMYQKGLQIYILVYNLHYVWAGAHLRMWRRERGLGDPSFEKSPDERKVKS